MNPISEIKKIAKGEWLILHKEMTQEAMKVSFQVNREYTLSKDQYTSTTNDDYWALALAVRDRMVERWIKTQQRYHKQNLKRVYYLSMEFLIGRLLGNNMYNLGLERPVKNMLDEMGLDLDEIRDQELDAGLGNGGLGRLAACFLDSMATLGIPAHGYGIRYDYGIFNQKIINGYQVEFPDEWLRHGSPWEFARPEYTVTVKFYGVTQMYHDPNGRLRVQWVDTSDILAVPYDIPVAGYKNDVVNTLRLWAARSTENFDFEYFNNGDYEQAVHQKINSENITKVLYPNDDVSRGKELRLKQEYFLTAAAVSDILRRFKSENGDLRNLPEKVSIQLNDTHPTLAIVELMRILLDDHQFDWDAAWDVVSRTFAYTNHTLMPEALECWPVPLLEKLLPRHLQIIYEINARFLEQIARQFPGDNERLSRMSIIEEGDPKKVRMAHLATIGSFSVNGVSKLHSELLKTRVLNDFYQVFPSHFNNKTNGVTQRRWLLKANPLLSDLITQSIGDQWTSHLEELERLQPFMDHPNFRDRFRAIKLENKQALAEHIRKTTNVSIDPHSLFDVQVKRIHEYKRQLLFGFYVISEYLKIKNEPHKFIQPRTFLVGGKAAPGYMMAKLVIKFLNNIADVMARDPAVKDKIKLVFLENYRVSLAERIFPASELSQQISTAGMEASGTSNMKFMLNGALTIGTLDGANIEIADLVGPDNIFIFGHQAHQIEEMRKKGYAPRDFIHQSPMLEQIFPLITNGLFSSHTPGLFNPIVESIFNNDKYFICADFEAYRQTQDRVSALYADKEEWTKKSIFNICKAGYFSSDRTISEYAKDIWKVL